MKPKIVVTRQMTPPVMERIALQFDAVLPPAGGMTPDLVLRALEETGAPGLLFNSGTPFTPDYVSRLPDTLRVAASCSVGFDHVDVPATKAKGLIVTNTPEVLDASVADFAFLLLLAAARRLHEYDATVRDGWTRYFGVPEFLGTDLAGKTLAIVGMGRIGQALARRAKAFDMNVIYHNRNRLSPDDEAGAEYYDSLDGMLPHTDFLSLHAPLTPDTADLLNARTVALLRDGAIVVNTARGGLVNDDALIAALQSGKVRAAGLDVYKGEPKIDPRYATLKNVILAPHMASATEETRTAMGMLCLDNIAAVLSGRSAVTPL